MEKEILREMVLDRSKKTNLLRRKIRFQVDRIEKMREALGEIQRSLAEQLLEHQEEIEKIIQERSVVERTLAKLGNDLHQQGPSLHRYAEIVKQQSSSPKNADSSYVIRMQAQLCKVMHAVGITDHYHELVQGICDAELKYLEDSRKLVVERMSKKELELLNSILAKDQQCRAIEASQNAVLESERLRIEKLKESLYSKRNNKNKNRNDASEDEDETLDETEETEEDADDINDEEEEREEKKQQELFVVTSNEPYSLHSKPTRSSPKTFLDPVREDDEGTTHANLYSEC